MRSRILLIALLCWLFIFMGSCSGNTTPPHDSGEPGGMQKVPTEELTKDAGQPTGEETTRDSSDSPTPPISEGADQNYDRLIPLTPVA